VTSRARILFVAEAVSLAHVARPSLLGAALDPGAYDIHFASNGQFAFCHDALAWSEHHLAGIPTRLFVDRLARGKPVFTGAELQSYVEDDLRLLAEVKPDLVVSDFRLSLGVAARHAGVPLLSICNAHWSPYLPVRHLPAPDLPIARLLGHRLFDFVFNAAWPIASRFHLHSANRVRRRYHMADYRSLGEYYCDGDIVMYADMPSLIAIPDLPERHVFLGPVIWSPRAEVWPDWWAEVTAESGRFVYATLGSTGNVDRLADVIAACREVGAKCLVATAGRVGFPSAPPWVYAAPFLPGSEAAALSCLVICNGGSATAHQALAQGRPVLGVCSNLDQLQTMESISAVGAGAYMRASEASPGRLREMLRRMLDDPGFGVAAQRIQSGLKEFDAPSRFSAIVASALKTS
jgi:UDP:flavonoid glycosyltransferase YjiC (YdhE family)